MDEPQLPHQGIDTNGWVFLIEALSLLSANLTDDIVLLIENLDYLENSGYATPSEVSWIRTGAEFLRDMGTTMTDVASLDAGDKQPYIDLAHQIGPLPLLYTIIYELTRVK
jgi:hypothetical protein